MNLFQVRIRISINFYKFKYGDSVFFHLNKIFKYFKAISKSGSVKFSLIESVICLVTDLAVKQYFSLIHQWKKYFSLLNQLISIEVIIEIQLIHGNLFLAIWISQIPLIISRFWLIQIQRASTFSTIFTLRKF